MITTRVDNSILPDTHSNRSAFRLVDWLLAVSFVLSLIAYAYLGSYSRYMADDYSAVRMVRTYGFVGAQISSYQRWTGRFSFTFVADLLAMIGPATPPFIPGLLLALLFAGTAWAIYEIQALSGRISWARVVLFAGFLIFATLETAPNVSQSLYWQTGALTYLAPFIPLSFYVGVTIRGVRRKHNNLSYRLNLFAAGILTFVAGGFSDAFVVLQTCALILSLLAIEKLAGPDFKSRIRPFVIVGLAGSLLAFVIVAMAPGNSVRLTYFPHQLGVFDLVRLSARYSLGFVARQVLNNPLITVALFTLPLLMMLRNHGPKWDRRQCTAILLFVPPAVFLLMMCCVAPGVYAISTMLPERAQILLSVIFVCGTVVWSRAAGEYVTGYLLPIRHVPVLTTATLLLLILWPQISFFSVLGLRDKARSYANDWERQDSELKTARKTGVTDVVVPQIGDFQSRIGKGPSDLHLRADAAFWINRNIATYYGLRSVRSTDDVREFSLSEDHLKVPTAP